MYKILKEKANFVYRLESIRSHGRFRRAAAERKFVELVMVADLNEVKAYCRKINRFINRYNLLHFLWRQLTFFWCVLPKPGTFYRM